MSLLCTYDGINLSLHQYPIVEASVIVPVSHRRGLMSLYQYPIDGAYVIVPVSHRRGSLYNLILHTGDFQNSGATQLSRQYTKRFKIRSKKLQRNITSLYYGENVHKSFEQSFNPMGRYKRENRRIPITKIVLPILIYGAEIWGTKYAGPIEAVHIKYCKYSLRVSSSTSNAAVMGELGRHPLHIHYFCRCVKFWFNIIHNNASEPRLRTSTYNNLKRLDDNGRHTWATEIRYLL